MQRHSPSTLPRALRHGPCLRQRLAWLACSGLLCLLGLAVSMSHALAAPAGLPAGTAALAPFEVPAVLPAAGAAVVTPPCHDLPSPAGALDAEAGSLADPDFMSATWLLAGAARLQRPSGRLAPLQDAGVRPRLRPPRSPG